MEWGRRRWNVENGFKVEKHDGFGLEHTFCNDDTAGRNYHILMEIAYALWQVFATGVIPRLAEGCRKMPQSGWAAVIWIATHVIGFRDLPVESTGIMRMRRFHLVA